MYDPYIYYFEYFLFVKFQQERVINELNKDNFLYK